MEGITKYLLSIIFSGLIMVDANNFHEHYDNGDILMQKLTTGIESSSQKIPPGLGRVCDNHKEIYSTRLIESIRIIIESNFISDWSKELLHLQKRLLLERDYPHSYRTCDVYTDLRLVALSVSFSIWNTIIFFVVFVECFRELNTVGQRNFF